jgi:hypothetical protein
VSQFSDGIDVVDPDSVFESAHEAAFVLVETNLLQLTPSSGKTQSRSGHCFYFTNNVLEQKSII